MLIMRFQLEVDECGEDDDSAPCGDRDAAVRDLAEDSGAKLFWRCGRVSWVGS